MNTIKEYTVTDVKNLTEAEVFDLAEELEEIKGYRAYFVDLPGYLGYSCLVYGDGRQITHANDYSVNHRSTKTNDELKKNYIDSLNKKLFTAEELKAPLKDYAEYRRKCYYIINLLPLRRDSISVFDMEITVADKKKYPVYLPFAFRYYKEADRWTVEKVTELFNALIQRRHEAEQDYGYMKKAFYYELANHEYCINTYQGDWDTLSAFGNIGWRGQGAEAREEYFKDLQFTDIQIAAFNDARREYLKDAAENGWG